MCRDVGTTLELCQSYFNAMSRVLIMRMSCAIIENYSHFVNVNVNLDFAEH